MVCTLLGYIHETLHNNIIRLGNDHKNVLLCDGSCHCIDIRLHVCIICMCIHTYIYIYIYRHRQRWDIYTKYNFMHATHIHTHAHANTQTKWAKRTKCSTGKGTWCKWTRAMTWVPREKPSLSRHKALMHSNVETTASTRSLARSPMPRNEATDAAK